jgi:hypothetical protein
LGHRNNKVNSEKNCLSAFVDTNKSIITSKFDHIGRFCSLHGVHEVLVLTMQCVSVRSHGNRVITNKRPHATLLSSWETQCSQHTPRDLSLIWAELCMTINTLASWEPLHTTRTHPKQTAHCTRSITVLSLAVVLLANKFPTFYVTVSFITVFTTFLCCLVSLAWWIQPTPSNPVYLRSISILFWRCSSGAYTGVHKTRHTLIKREGNVVPVRNDATRREDEGGVDV